jgi:hypothetical protein
MLAGAVVWGVIGAYFGAATLLGLLWLMLLVAVYFVLSLGHVCRSTWTAHRRQSVWLKRYRVVMTKNHDRSQTPRRAWPFSRKEWAL